MPPPNTTYKTFILADERFTVGDSVMIKNNDSRGNKADFIGKLARIHTDTKGEVLLDLMWYYRPEELPGGRKPHHGKDEIVESDHKDTCHVWCVNSKCRVYALDEYESRGEAAKTEKGVILPEFFSRSFYLHKKQKLKTPLPLYCTCRQPQNPDKLLASCDSCHSWFHGSCVGLTRAKADKIKSWKCPSCTGGKAKAGAKRKATAATGKSKRSAK